MGWVFSEEHSAWDGGSATEEPINQGGVLKRRVLVGNVGKASRSGAAVTEKIVTSSSQVEGGGPCHHGAATG